MPLRKRRLKAATYQALQEQLATAAALCSDEQVLDLADGLHDALRRRRRPQFNYRLDPSVEGSRLN